MPTYKHYTGGFRDSTTDDIGTVVDRYIDMEVHFREGELERLRARLDAVTNVVKATIAQLPVEVQIAIAEAIGAEVTD